LTPPPSTHTSTLSLHDALPIYAEDGGGDLLLRPAQPLAARQQREHQWTDPPVPAQGHGPVGTQPGGTAIALQLNMRPRKRFDYKCPIEVMSEVVQKAIAMRHDAPASIQ